MSYFFLLYLSPSLSLCMVFDSISSNIDEVLTINPSANVFVFGDFNVHHRDLLTYSGGTDRPVELCYGFLSQMFSLRWLIFLLGFLLGFSKSCSFRFISPDASIFPTMAFPPLGNSDHVVFSVSIDFPLNSKRDAPFHGIAYDYSRSDWDGLCDHLRDVS